MKNFLRSVTAFSLICLLAACGGTTSAPSGGKSGPHYKIGNAYDVKGVTYTPHEDYSYDETGIASWYGADFNHGTTANGEIFNKNELTAAHKTLPLPTLARVTNLDNGRSIVVRINDRGPFSGARIIDLSQRAAQLLGFEDKGTAKVRVQVLADESKAIADAMRHYGTTQVAAAEQAPPPEAAAAGAIETKTLEPIQTTPEIHKELVATQPLPVVYQVPVTGRNQIYVQAGSFTVMDNATKLKQRLDSLGPVSISDVNINGKLFHRVRVGPLADVPTADKTLKDVRKAGIDNARTIVD